MLDKKIANLITLSDKIIELKKSILKYCKKCGSKILCENCCFTDILEKIEELDK